MAERPREVLFRIEISRPQLRALLALFLFGLALKKIYSTEIQNFDITLPAPEAVYASLVTTGKGGGDTVLARDRGSVLIGNVAVAANDRKQLEVEGRISVVSGDVCIGQNPPYKCLSASVNRLEGDGATGIIVTRPEKEDLVKADLRVIQARIKDCPGANEVINDVREDGSVICVAQSGSGCNNNGKCEKDRGETCDSCLKDCDLCWPNPGIAQTCGTVAGTRSCSRQSCSYTYAQACRKGWCGDVHCDKDGGETCENCQFDCCPPRIVKCGDDICHPEENCASCPHDCGYCEKPCVAKGITYPIGSYCWLDDHCMMSKRCTPALDANGRLMRRGYYGCYYPKILCEKTGWWTPVTDEVCRDRRPAGAPFCPPTH